MIYFTPDDTLLYWKHKYRKKEHSVKWRRKETDEAGKENEKYWKLNIAGEKQSYLFTSIC